MWFIAAIVTLGAAYLFDRLERNHEEVAIACIPVIVGGLLITLIAAPWQVQLLLLVVALLSYPLIQTTRSDGG